VDGAGSCRRLAQLMRDLGWTPVRVRDLTRGGYTEQVQGYCREARVPTQRPNGSPPNPRNRESHTSILFGICT
jgi:hypothetical protein